MTIPAKNPLKIIGWFWHMYNVPFDKHLGEIKDLNVLSKISVLSLGLIMILAFFGVGMTENGEMSNTFAVISVLTILALAVLWVGYLPFLIVRIVKYYFS